MRARDLLQGGHVATQLVMGRRVKRRPSQLSDTELLADLIDQLRAVISAELGGQDIQAQPGHEDTVAYVSGWLTHIDRSIDALLLLNSQGLRSVAQPLQRLIIEHAVSCAIVARDAGAWTAFLKASYDGAMKLRRAIMNNELEVPEDLEHFIEFGLEEEPDPYKRFRQIRNRFESLGESGARLYQAWLEETQLSHSGLPTSALFLKNSDGNTDAPMTTTSTPQFEEDEWYMIATALDAYLMAADSLSTLIISDPLRAGIDHLNSLKHEQFIRRSDAFIF